MQKTKRFLKQIAYILILTCLCGKTCAVYAAETSIYTPNPQIEYSYSENVTCGTIRYISQVVDGTHFDKAYWPYGSFGKYSSPSQECYTSSISMALSYLGINKTPKEILEANNGSTNPNGWGATYLTTDVPTGMQNYINGQEKYSPVCIHLPKYSSRGHYLLLVGQVSESLYQVLDPWECAVEYVSIDGQIAKYIKSGIEITDTIDKVGQWYCEKTDLPVGTEMPPENSDVDNNPIEYNKPKALSKLKATTISSTVVKLSWAKQDDVTGYKVYKKTSGQSYKLTKTVAKNNCKITVKPDKTYWFKVVPYRMYEDVQLNGEKGTCKYVCKQLVISAVGDCTLGVDSRYNNKFNDMYNKKSTSYFFQNVKQVLEKDDITIANFEGTLTDSSSRADKKFTFKGNSSYAKILTAGSVEVVNLANNHTKDFGSKGLKDTKAALKNYKIPYCINSTIAYKNVDGVKVAFLGFNALDTLNKKDVKSGIANAKSHGADLIITSFHWGIEREHQPISLQKSLGYYAIDQGADLVLGHHPHVLQGIEKYKKHYIVYSLGNFCFGGNSNPADKDTMIYQQTFYIASNGTVLNETQSKIIPCSLSGHSNYNDFQPKKLSGKSRTRVLNRLRQFSKGMHIQIDSKGYLM